MQRDPSSSLKKEEAEGVRSSWKVEDRMIVAARLHDLELANQQLAIEKTQLQRQLDHVLHRLASDRFCRDSSDLCEFATILRDTIKPPSPKSVHANGDKKEAPIASGESTNGRFSVFEYSSLSDTYEDLNLRQDLVRSISLAITSPIPSGSIHSVASETETHTPVVVRLHSRTSSEPEHFMPSEMMRSETIIDTIASSSTQLHEIKTLSVSAASSDEPERESVVLGFPPSISYSLSSSTSNSTKSIVDRQRTTSLRPTEPGATTLRSVLFPIPSSSLPTTPHKLMSRKNIQRDIADAKASASKWFSKPREKFTTFDAPEQMSPPKVFISRKKLRHVKYRVLHRLSTSSSPDEQIRHPGKRLKSGSQATTPRLMMRQALKRVSNKPRLKVGASEDFLNDFFSSGFKETTSSVHLHAAMLTGKASEVATAITRLFRHLNAYTCVRHHCFLVQTVPASDLQRNLDNFRLVGSRTAFENLCKKDTSSSDIKSLHITTPVKLCLPQPLPNKPCSTSKCSELQSSTSTEYHQPPVEDSNNQESENVHQNFSCLRPRNIHEGKLLKLSGRFKIWQTFWCVLASKCLLFYKNENEVERWPRKCLDLAEIRSIERGIKRRMSSRSAASSPISASSVQTPCTFHIVMHSGKSYILRTLNSNDLQMWETNLKRTLRRTQAEQIFKMHCAQLVISGWLRRYRKGQSQHVWCMLMGTFLVYSSNPSGTSLTGYRDLSMTYLRCPVQETSLADPLVNPASTAMHPIAADHEHSFVVQHDCDTTDSESDTGIDLDDAQRRTIALWAPNRDPVYLVCSTDSEYERWKYHLIRACWLSTFLPEAPEKEPEGRFVQIWELLVRPIYATQRWHTEFPIREPLSRVIDTAFEKAAIKLSEKLNALSNINLGLQDKSQEDQEKGSSYRFPVNAEKYNLIKDISKLCFENTGLKDELFLQLIKQATPTALSFRFFTDIHFRTEPLRRRTRMAELFCGHHRDSTQRGKSVSRTLEVKRFGTQSARGYAQKWIPVITMWECISIYSTMFLPSPPVLACLQAFLLQFTSKTEGAMKHSMSPYGSPSQRSKSIDVQKLILELCKFAAFCSDMLIRCRIRGGRNVPPSCFEVVAISLRNPYTHSLPFSLPIHVNLPSGYEVVSFDGTMKVSHLLLSIVNKLGLSEAVSQNMCLCGLYCRISGLQYTLGCAPAQPRLIYLEPTWNICDVISLYEVTLTRTDEDVNFNLEDMTIDLVFLVQAISKQALTSRSSSVNRLMDILAHQLHEDVCSGELNLILRGSHFLELTALMCRCDHGDYAELQRRQETNLTELVNRYFPQQCLLTWGREDDQALIELKLLLLDRWTKVSRETSVSEQGEDLLRASQAYTTFLFKLHPAAACIRHFPCQLINLPDIPVDEKIWLAPCHDHISLLRIYSFDATAINPTFTCGEIGDMVSGMACFKRIPFNQVITFGVQQAGAFFLVYSENSRSKSKQKTSHRRYSGSDDREAQKQRRSGGDRQLEKLLFFFRDLCQINELCQVLSFYVVNMQ